MEFVTILLAQNEVLDISMLNNDKYSLELHILAANFVIKPGPSATLCRDNKLSRLRTCA